MKLNKETLKRIIKEELQAVLSEGGNDAAARRGTKGDADSTLGVDAEKRRSAAFTGSQQTKQNQLGNTSKIAADLDKDGQFKVEPGAKQTGINDRYAQQDDKLKKGTIIKKKIIPWAMKNAGSLWEKSNASSEQEFKAYLGKMSSTDPEELAGAESALIDVLGQDLYDSILKGRGILDKFGGLFKRGSFTENKRRR